MTKNLILQAASVEHLVRPAWPPLRHIERGWKELTDDERAAVEIRLHELMSGPLWNDACPRDALATFFAFLAQVETIAIEVPLRFLAKADDELKPLLRQQLVDEVFHSVLFARIAHELHAPATQPPAPLASAEALLAKIRSEPDMAICATLLNLVAEGWVEVLFDHARTWGIADRVFDAVLADESRHVHQAERYLDEIDPLRAQKVLAEFELGLMAVLVEPTLALSILALSGADRFRELTRALTRKHEHQLGLQHLQPSLQWQLAKRELARALDERRDALARAQKAASSVADTSWRRTARSIWGEPNDPTMRGGFDVRVGHIPTKALTATMVAAVARAWATPEGRSLNRVLARGSVWQLEHVNVGVRVLVGDDVATVVIADADRRSIGDIGRMIGVGLRQLKLQRAKVRNCGIEPRGIPRELAGLLPPLARHSVTISNVGVFGLIEGSGALSPYAPTTDITVGAVRKLPVWRGVLYWPAPHVHLGCLQDHRVVDGREAGKAMTLVREQLTPRAFRRLRAAADTFSDEHAVKPLEQLFESYPTLRQDPTLAEIANLITAVGFE